MAGIQVKVNDRAVRRRLEQLRRKASNLKPVLREIGEEMLISTDERFDDEQTPSGQKWQNLSQKTLKRKTEKRKRPKILQQDGHLKDSIHYQVSKDELRVGTNLVYGATHQLGDDGKRNIPARPYLGFSRQDQRMIVRILKRWLGR